MQIDAFLDSLLERGDGAPEWAIAEYEKSIGAPLPADYRAFLTQCNGGIASSDTVCNYEVRNTLPFAALADSKLRQFDVYHVLGFREEEWLSLESRNETLKGQIPPSVIWIMDTFDACGTTCLGVKGQHVGKVYFWDRDGTYPEGDDENIREFDLIADTFTDFIAKLEHER